jgi:dephospho-CoA kinase
VNDLKIIGIGGLPRSGKDTLAELLIHRGWFGFSFGDYNHKFSFERHKDKPDPISRENTTETSNWLRQTYGPDVILKAALAEYEQASQTKHYEGLVLYSVRAPIEVDWILAHGGELIWVESSDEVRYRRAMQHLRQGEIEIPLEEFKRQEDEQWQPQPTIPREVQMDISYVKSHATHTLLNNSENLRDFLQSAEELIATLDH